jgi:hypothetical protein
MGTLWEFQAKKGSPSRLPFFVQMALKAALNHFFA